ncbi:hypothetical protein LMH87_009650 [Akanthomyces muscarius]|uniref:Uncharacterized protein n=1 Tax=Akanthomyces muscarius TaxID=2231603 RepID=A0A9W8UMD9_AKAMU|nr:hypothetical protein LMH87_009650 [Akanthomyces muscarius]KAJ4153147.1 hypothetical protein LMH87_009650 [Akanthomyces muscarius]
MNPSPGADLLFDFPFRATADSFTAPPSTPTIRFLIFCTHDDRLLLLPLLCFDTHLILASLPSPTSDTPYPQPNRCRAH